MGGTGLGLGESHASRDGWSEEPDDGMGEWVAGGSDRDLVVVVVVICFAAAGSSGRFGLGRESTVVVAATARDSSLTNEFVHVEVRFDDGDQD